MRRLHRALSSRVSGFGGGGELEARSKVCKISMLYSSRIGQEKVQATVAFPFNSIAERSDLVSLAL